MISINSTLAGNDRVLDGHNLRGGGLKIHNPDSNLQALFRTSGVGNNLSHDGPLSQSISISNSTQVEIPEWQKKAEKYGKFIKEKISGKVAATATTLNFISSPLRLIPNNSITKFINNLSLGMSKIHQLVFGVGGLLVSLRKNNPLHTLSFGWEAITSLFNLRGIYLFKAIASNTDIIPFCLEHLIPTSFNSYSEGLQKTWGALKHMFSEIKNNPKILLTREALDKHVPLVGALVSTLGVLIGIINDVTGGLIRTTGGIGNDFGLLFKDKPDEQTSGRWYISGSLFDMSARLVQIIGDLLGFSKEGISRCRDALHELALGADKMGQRYFLMAVNNGIEKASLVE